MKISGQDKYLLSDSIVPDIFIHEFMPRLDSMAVKCYLLLLSAFQNGKREIAKKDLSLRLSLSVREIEKCLQDLAEEGIIQIENEGVLLTDLKAIELRNLLEKNREEKSIIISPAIMSEREQVVTAINNEYFQGLMTHAWYDMIDDWFLNYRFEPAVVQALFAEATASDKWGKLNRPFLNSIAARWHRHEIRTFSELSAFYEENEKFLQLYKHICKTLRISFTEPGIRLVESWVEELGYEREIIDLALEETTGSRNPNLRYVDTILRRWHSQGLKNKADVKRELASWQQSKKDTASRTKAGGNRANYAGSEKNANYDEAFGLQYPAVSNQQPDNDQEF